MSSRVILSFIPLINNIFHQDELKTHISIYFTRQNFSLYSPCSEILFTRVIGHRVNFLEGSSPFSPKKLMAAIVDTVIPQRSQKPKKDSMTLSRVTQYKI